MSISVQMTWKTDMRSAFRNTMLTHDFHFTDTCRSNHSAKTIGSTAPYFRRTSSTVTIISRDRCLRAERAQWAIVGLSHDACSRHPSSPRSCWPTYKLSPANSQSWPASQHHTQVTFSATKTETSPLLSRWTCVSQSPLALLLHTFQNGTSRRHGTFYYGPNANSSSSISKTDVITAIVARLWHATSGRVSKS